METPGENMYTNGTYQHQNPGWFKEDSAWKALVIYELIKRNRLTPATISEVGCGMGEILLQLAELIKEVKSFTGYDIAPFAIEAARKKETERVRFYLGDFEEAMQTPTDLLLVIDVIEHVPDYYGFLQKLRNKSAHFIFHVPLDLSCRTLLKPQVIRQQRKDVGHLHYFSKEHILWVLEDNGFTIVNVEYTFSETDRNTPRSFKAYIKRQARNFSFFLSKEWSVKLWGGYSIMIFCTRNE